mgnify:CR=1 FL=1|jgi:Predicted metal-dependent protease of the PAD1/JAB1 superfamily
MRVIVNSSIMNILKTISKKAYPFEACALLIGNIQGDDVIIRHVEEVDNADRSSTSFSVIPEDLVRVYEYAKSINLDVIGIFHSHPYSKAYPSSKDLRYMSINQVPWLILSLLDGDVKAFIYSNEEVEVKELDIVII